MKRFAALAVLVLVTALAAPSGIATAAAPVSPWRITPSPNLGTVNNHLREVSCVNNVRCVAVGYTHNPATGLGRSLAAHLSGGVWSFIPVPPRGNDFNTLFNVSCVSTTRCVAVGYYFNVPTGYFKTLIATFNGTRWALASTPNRVDVHNYLLGVDCIDATHCVAVGISEDPETHQERSLVLRLNGGTTWSMPTVPARADTNNRLVDVSCGDASNCKAAGYTIDHVDASIRTLVVSLSSGTWSIDNSLDRAGENSLFRDISCPTATTCVAVGASDPDSSPGSLVEKSLIETFAAGSWAFAGTTDRAGFDNHLWAVSCSNPTNCVAAGMSQNDDLARPLIQTLADGTWGLTSPAPYRSGTFNYVYGLSCPTFRNCKAAGDYLHPVANRFRTSVLTNSAP
jgi:hypothetical protein